MFKNLWAFQMRTKKRNSMKTAITVLAFTINHVVQSITLKKMSSSLFQINSSFLKSVRKSILICIHFLDLINQDQFLIWKLNERFSKSHTKISQTPNKLFYGYDQSTPNYILPFSSRWRKLINFLIFR